MYLALQISLVIQAILLPGVASMIVGGALVGYCIFNNNKTALAVAINCILSGQISIAASRKIGYDNSDDMVRLHSLYEELGADATSQIFDGSLVYEPIWWGIMALMPSGLTAFELMFFITIVYGIVVNQIFLIEIFNKNSDRKIIIFCLLSIVILNSFFVATQLSKQSVAFAILMLGLFTSRYILVISTFAIHSSNLITLFLTLISYKITMRRMIFLLLIPSLLTTVLLAVNLGGIQEYVILKIANSIDFNDNQFLFFIYPVLVAILYVVLGGGFYVLLIILSVTMLTIYAQMDLLLYRIFFVFAAGLPILLLFISQNKKIENRKFLNFIGLISTYFIASGLWLYRMVMLDESNHFSFFYQYGPISSAIAVFMQH